MADAISIPSPSAVRTYSVRLADPRTAVHTGGLSFKFLIVFFILLYSNLSLAFPVLDFVRPAQTVGGLALAFLLYEKLTAGQSLDWAWPQGALLAGFVFAAGLSVFGAVWPAYALEAVSNLVKMTVVYLLIVNTVTNESRLRTLLWTMVLCGLFPAAGSLWYWHQGIKVEGRAAWFGQFANPNEMAYSLVILLPLAAALSKRLDWIRRIPVWMLMGAFLLPVYLSFSRGGLIGLAGVAGYMGWRQKNRTARTANIGLPMPVLVLAPLYWSRDDGFSDIRGDANFNERLTTYRIALAMYADSPVFGVGINCSSVAWPLYASTGQLSHHKWLITHNTFLQALSETGTAGFVLLLSFFAATLWKAARISRLKTSQTGVAELLAGLEISFCGFLVCGLSGGYVMSWFPYLLAGLIAAAGQIAERGA